METMNKLTRLESYLREHGARYDVDVHPERFTAQETAQVEHVPGKAFVKVVIAKVDGDLVMLAVPAPHEVDLDAVAWIMGADQVELAHETDFVEIFEDCEVGAMPPFGNLYDVPVLVDETLAEDDHIVFNAGTHRRAVRMSFADFHRLVRPMMGTFSHLVH